jgi:hypothetical protein
LIDSIPASAQNRMKMREEPGLFAAIIKNLSTAKNEVHAKYVIVVLYRWHL